LANGMWLGSRCGSGPLRSWFSGSRIRRSESLECGIARWAPNESVDAQGARPRLPRARIPAPTR
jgi:hypothetical protein